MGEFLTALAATGLVVVATGAIVAWLVARRVVLANRVVPGRRSPAPLRWLWSCYAPARLHRRLRRAVLVVTNAMAPFRTPARRGQPHLAPPTDLINVADELVERAAHLDDRLVTASGLSGLWRRRLLGELGAAVVDIEASVAHLERLAVGIAGPANCEPVLDLRARLGALEAALAEVAHATAAGAARAGGPRAPMQPPTG
jgi:hypothetical protein